MNAKSINPYICVPGVYIIDRYTYYALEFLEGVERGSKKTMGQFLEVCPQRLCMSTVGNRTDLFARYIWKFTSGFFVHKNMSPNKANWDTTCNCPEECSPATQWIAKGFWIRVWVKIGIYLKIEQIDSSLFCPAGSGPLHFLYKQVPL